MQKVVGMVLLTFGIAQANGSGAEKDQPVQEKVEQATSEKKAGKGITQHRMEKMLVAGIITGACGWTLKRLYNEWKLDRATEAGKGARWRWYDDGHYAVIMGAVAYLTLRSGSYMLKSAHKMVFK